jgi:hypothetical protein
MVNTNSLLAKQGVFSFQVGDGLFFGKDAYVTSFEIFYPRIVDIPMRSYGGPVERYTEPLGPIEANMHLVLPNNQFGFNPLTGIRHKKVEDCSVEELAYAIRMKIPNL